MESQCFSISAYASYDQNLPKATSITVAVFNTNHHIVVTNFYDACTCLVHQNSYDKTSFMKKRPPLDNYIPLVVNNTLCWERYI